MATINATTLDACERVQYFVRTSEGGLKQLPFELVTIDQDAQFYQPISLAFKSDTGLERRGKFVGVVILDRNAALPFPPQNAPTRGQYGCWEFQGR